MLTACIILIVAFCVLAISFWVTYRNLVYLLKLTTFHRARYDAMKPLLEAAGAFARVRHLVTADELERTQKMMSGVNHETTTIMLEAKREQWKALDLITEELKDTYWELEKWGASHSPPFRKRFFGKRVHTLPA